MDRKIIDKKGSYFQKKGKVLKICDNGNGYKLIYLTKGCTRKNFYIHRLVAETFIPNPNCYKEINHIDNDTSNNNINNLEWCDRSYNVKYSFDCGRHVAPRSMLGKTGKNNHLSKPVKQIDIKTGKVIKVWENAHEVARQTGFCRVSISKCCLGKQHTSMGFKWAFVN